MPQDLDPKTQQTLQRMAGFFQEGAMTKTEAEKFLKTIMEFVLKLDKRQEQEIQTLQQAVSQLMTKIEGKFDIKLGEMRKEVDSLFVSERVGKLEKKHEEMLSMADMKVKSLKNGKDGMPGLRGERGPAGSPDKPEEVRNKLETLEGDERLDKSAIKGLDDLEQKIEKIGNRRVIAGPSANAVQVYDISSQCDGSTTTFNVPKYRVALKLEGTQEPFLYRPIVDFTLGNGKISLVTSQVSAPATGQTLMFWYLK